MSFLTMISLFPDYSYRFRKVGYSPEPFGITRENIGCNGFKGEGGGGEERWMWWENQEGTQWRYEDWGPNCCKHHFPHRIRHIFQGHRSFNIIFPPSCIRRTMKLKNSNRRYGFLRFPVIESNIVFSFCNFNLPLPLPPELPPREFRFTWLTFVSRLNEAYGIHWISSIRSS